MFFLLMVPVFFFVSAVHGYLQLYAPSNMLVTWIRMTPPRWRHVPFLAGLAVATLIAMHLLAEAVAVGAPGWLNLVVLILAWNAIKLGLAAAFGSTRCLFRSLLGRGAADTSAIVQLAEEATVFKRSWSAFSPTHYVISIGVTKICEGCRTSMLRFGVELAASASAIPYGQFLALREGPPSGVL